MAQGSLLGRVTSLKRYGSSLLLVCGATVVLSLPATQFSATASAQSSAHSLASQWRPLSPAEFENYRHAFASLDINAYRDDIFITGGGFIKILRLESPDFCSEELCLTLVTTACGKPACPSTTLLGEREVELEKYGMSFFGGSQIIRFPRAKNRSIFVLFNKRFVSVWSGFGP